MGRKQVPEMLGHNNQAIRGSEQGRRSEARNPEPWLLRKFWGCSTDNSKPWYLKRVLREGGEAGELE